MKGSCLCGKVQYQCESAARLMNHCHCSMCRKVHGAAFGSFVHASADGFRWLSGEERITQYDSSPDNVRAFCSICGSNVPVIEAADNNVIIPAGTLDDDPGLRPAMHIFTAFKAPWHDITDDTPQFDEFPPDEWLKDILKSTSSGAA